jgi:hypothetical protein
MAHELKVVIANEMADVVLAAREVVVEADDIVTVIQQPFAKV